MAEKKNKTSHKQRINKSRKKPAKQTETAVRLNQDEIALYGIHAVKAALSNRKRHFIKVFATRNAADRLAPLLESRELMAEIVQPEAISALTRPQAIHQGIAAIVKPLDGQDIYDVQDARLVVVLDQITDPHNVGAIIRSAVALGADAILSTHRNAPKETGLLAKTASGGLDFIHFIHVANLSQALLKLRDFGFVSVGLDSEGPQDLTDTLYGDKIALVLGAEGTGLRRLTRERCDVLARLDMPGPIKSLNVSNAAVLSLFLATRHLNQ